jgi:hypothetical protein
MIRLMIAETTVIRRILLKIRSSILKEVVDGMIISTTMISAGPAAKADAKNRGLIKELFQKGLAGSP